MSSVMCLAYTEVTPFGIVQVFFFKYIYPLFFNT